MSEPLTREEREALRRRFTESEFEPALVGVSPDIIRRLLAALERAEKERDEARAAIQGWMDDARKEAQNADYWSRRAVAADRERDEARAALNVAIGSKYISQGDAAVRLSALERVERERDEERLGRLNAQDQLAVAEAKLARIIGKLEENTGAFWMAGSRAELLAIAKGER